MLKVLKKLGPFEHTVRLEDFRVADGEGDGLAGEQRLSVHADIKVVGDMITVGATLPGRGYQELNMRFDQGLLSLLVFGSCADRGSGPDDLGFTHDHPVIEVKFGADKSFVKLASAERSYNFALEHVSGRWGGMCNQDWDNAVTAEEAAAAAAGSDASADEGAGDIQESDDAEEEPSEPATDSSAPAVDTDKDTAFTASVRQGLAELDAGLYVSSTEMDAWAKSLFTPSELPIPLMHDGGNS
jgi:hypothetical protein